MKKKHVLYIEIDVELYNQVRAKLKDPLTETVPKGSMSHLVRRLLIQWVREEK